MRRKTEKLDEVHRSRQVPPARVAETSEREVGAQSHPQKLVAVILTGLKDQLTTIGWLKSAAVEISCEEEPIERTTEDY